MDISVVQTSVLLVAAYLSAQLLYRLFFSPISSIPGPRLAAATWWYEFYYDIFNYGKYVFKITSLHEKYGPILRISPYEVHISDPEFYDTLYAASNTNRKDRWSWYTAGLGLPESTLGTVKQTLHKNRRAAMSSFFSKQTVRSLEPLIHERAIKLASRFQTLAEAEEVIPINLAFSAFSNGAGIHVACGELMLIRYRCRDAVLFWSVGPAHRSRRI
jgi:Cytochrome P450